MTVILVTAYVPQKDKLPRRDYEALGRKLLDVDVTTDAYLNYPLEDCWAHSFLKKAKLPKHGDPQKDTREFITIQLNKSHWLRQSRTTIDDTLVWVDYGIFHLKGIQAEDIRAFIERVPTGHDKIISPSCYPLGSRSMDMQHPYWFFAGGVLVVPCELAAWFVKKVEEETLDYLSSTGYCTWEVNVWAMIAWKYPSMFEFYPADHNASIFTGYRGGTE